MIRWLRCDPTGNITALVTDPVAARDRTAVANRIMAADHTVEQVGFLSAGEGDIRLDMAGGEFCGNATLSAAAVYAARKGMVAGIVSVSVSGTAHPVTVTLKMTVDGYIGRVAMPLPTKIAPYPFTLNGQTTLLPTVTFDGITHAIVRGECGKTQAERAIAVWAEQIGADAFGLMLVGGDTLMPLVYVAEAGTLVWEQSCASGTSAVAAWRASEERRGVEVSFDEPGGRMKVSAAYEGKVTGLWMTGTVTLEEQCLND